MFKNLPIRRKLMTVNLLTSGVVLLLTCLAFITYEIITLRRGMVLSYSSRAQIISANSTASLAFQDPADANGVLATLTSDPRIIRACIYDNQGRVFAKYPTNTPARSFPQSPAGSGYQFASSSLAVFCPVAQNQRRLGMVYLESNLSALTDRYAAYAWLAGGILCGSILVAFLLSSFLQKQISQPILALAETASNISRHRDYSTRARKSGDDELGSLTDAFNQLLASIEQRDKALHAEIEERKRAEGKVQAQLARLELLHRITRAAGERQDLHSIFQVVIRTLEEQLPLDFCCIGLYDQVAALLKIVHVGIKSEPIAMELALPAQAEIPIDQNGLLRCVQGRLVYEPDISRAEFPFPQRLARGGMAALVIAPLVVESQVFGVLVSARRTPDSFSSGECEFLRQLSEHVGLAAHQAQLNEALQRAYDDLRQTQQAVMQQERLKALGQMASGIAHDINNAISPITLYTEYLLERESNLSPRAREYLTTIQRASDDVAQTVARMREFYRQREPELNLVPVNLNQMMEQIIMLTRARWSDMPQQRGAVIRLETEFAADLPAIAGIESEIREALVNLVINAVDAMPEGGTLTLRTRLSEGPGRVVQVEVCDTGIGMDEDTRARCLEPFFTTKGERGTGLGLAIVYGIARRHNADTDIQSAPGQGTTVSLRFPVPQAPLPEGATVPASFPVPTRLRLLLVDDDPVLLKSLRDILEADGHHIVTANGGQQGIEAFRSAHARNAAFAAVITDLGMPYVDGRQVASEVKRISLATPVIMMTGWGQRLAAEGDIPPHVDRVLNKPPKLRELREALASTVLH